MKRKPVTLKGLSCLFVILTILYLLCCVTAAWAGSQTTSSTLASTIITRARYYLNEPTASFWSDAELLVYLNDGTLDIAARTHCLEDVETEILVEAQQIYPLGDPFIVVKHVVYNDEKALLKGNIQEIGQVLGSGEGDELGEPAYWAQWENNVIVYPGPDSTCVAEGTDKVTDGIFAADTEWTWGAGWAHDATNDEADATASDADLEQDVSASPNETYKVVWTVSNYSAGSVTAQVGGVDGTAVSANGTNTEYIKTTGIGNLKFQATGFTGTVDTVSVKRVADIDVYVVDRPVTVASNENVLVPAQYDRALVYYIVGQALKKDSRVGLSTGYMAEYLAELDRYRQDLNVQPKPETE
jgi:hypothetical protein